MWRKGTLVHCWWECRLVQPLWKTVWNFLKKLKVELPYDPVIPLLGMYPKKAKTLIQKNMCIFMLRVLTFYRVTFYCSYSNIWAETAAGPPLQPWHRTFAIVHQMDICLQAKSSELTPSGFVQHCQNGVLFLVMLPPIYYIPCLIAVSYTHLTLPTTGSLCRSRWSPDH